MKVILLEDVKGQGKKGEMKEVSDGYGRNYLIPHKLAVEANTDNINSLKMKEKAKAAQIAAEKEKALENVKQLDSTIIKIKAKAGSNGKLFGSITSKEISEAIAGQCGINIEKNKIVQAEPIKAFGSFDVKVKFGYEINGTAHVMVIEEK